jgi:molybdopterin molybdotransferase
MPMERGITLERAISLVQKEKKELSIETIHLDDSHGRILAEPLVSKVNDPRFDNSAMDGWAVRKEDFLESKSINLSIVGISKAGESSPPSVNSGEACKIMTGAPIPRGANAIVMVEDSEIHGNKVIISGPARENYIRVKGENISEGEVILSKGHFMDAPSISLVATMGYDCIPVFCKPIIGIISTGDELIPPGFEINNWQIYESNSFGIADLVRKMGGTPIRYPAVVDSLDILRKSLDEAAKNCDLIITSGGVSMGDFDIVRKIMELEGEINFWRIKMRPGGPPIFGKWRKTPIFGLPGNPVSSHLVFLMIICPWFRASFQADEDSKPRLGRKVSVKILDSVKGAVGKTCLRRIRIVNGEKGLTATTHTHQGSGNIHSMVAHNGVTLLPPNYDANAGEIIEAFWLN